MNERLIFANEHYCKHSWECSLTHEQQGVVIWEKHFWVHDDNHGINVTFDDQENPLTEYEKKIVLTILLG